MDSKRWKEVERLFNAAMEREPEQREAFLAEACAGDESIRAEVKSLIAHGGPGGPLETPAMEVVALRIASDAESAGELMSGRTLGRYRVGEQLGRGGMGEVYLADDISLDRRVALKFLPSPFTGSHEKMARFEREAKLLASINHPNIAAIHGIEEAEGRRFLVLELVEGETLAKRLGRGPLPIKESLKLCLQIAKALEAANKHGIIHRDLKPGNIMLSSENRIKLLDFGLAKAMAHRVPRRIPQRSRK